MNRSIDLFKYKYEFMQYIFVVYKFVIIFHIYSSRLPLSFEYRLFLIFYLTVSFVMKFHFSATVFS